MVRKRLTMDVVPTTSSAAVSPPQKRKRLNLGALTLAEKQCIVNIYKQMLSDEPNVKMTAIVRKIVNALGVAETTIFRTIKEYRKIGNIASPKKLGGRTGIVIRTLFG